CMSPVDSLVLSMLSPWVPPGRVSIFTSTPGLAFLNPSMTACADLTTAASCPTSSERVLLPPPPALPLDDDDPPPRPELHALMVTSAAAATPAVASLRPAIFIVNLQNEGWEIRI